MLEMTVKQTNNYYFCLKNKSARIVVIHDYKTINLQLILYLNFAIKCNVAMTAGLDTTNSVAYMLAIKMYSYTSVDDFKSNVNLTKFCAFDCWDTTNGYPVWKSLPTE